MIWHIVKARNVITGVLFFAAVFAIGVLWAFGNFGGLEDAFGRLRP